MSTANHTDFLTDADTVFFPKFDTIEVQLTGEDGNAFAIIGAVTKAIRRNGHEGAAADAAAYSRDAMDQPSYDALLTHAMRTVRVS